MGRVINVERAGKDRTYLTRAVVLALRELMRQSQPDEITYDLASYIALALEGIAASIDPSVAAWEKRGYWVKADRFRMDWAWAETLGAAMRKAVLSDDWSAVAQVSVQIAQKLNGTQLPKRNRLGTPWVGAWQRLKAINSSR